ncbi:hypothetical protein [Klebsiella quasipneumoniae]|uniref:hypothetical protein n=1 Tax=Klebsiella quasipneumoniae TaxID=1463165 RepID=UPI001D116F58|nr:hypothetical protein [Klebsiella quasipneumoniae]
MKDHEIRELVNQLRDVAIKYHSAGQLREQIARTVRAAILQAGTLIGEGTKLPPLKCLEIVKFNADCALSDPESIYASEFFLSLDEAFGEKGNYIEPVQAKAVSMLIGEVLRLHNYQTGSSPVIPGAEQRIADAVELLKKAAPGMLADNSGPNGPLAGRMKSPAIPDGYVMVPKEATEKMLIAGLEEANPLGGLIDWDASRGDCNTREQVQEIFKAMLAAAQQEVKGE